MTTSATDERVLGLPTDLEEGNSGNEDKPSIAQTAIPKDSSETLGRCDKKQYEHCGAHPRYADVGQGLPPFGCVNWKPEPSVLTTQDTIEKRWYTRDGSVPIQIYISREAAGWAWSPERGDVPSRCLFTTEKDAINEARKFALGAETLWQNVIDMLDKRYDAIEDEEMKKGNHVSPKT